MAISKELLIRREMSLRQVMARLDRDARGIVLLVDDEGRLDETITDGDIRRAMIAGQSLDTTVDGLLAYLRRLGLRRSPVTASHDDSREKMLKIMQETGVEQLPVIDDQQRVVELVTLKQLVPDPQLPIQAVIMAGGFGKRLHPLTDDLPKPMLPVAGKPLMQRTIERLREAGIQRINITTHYLPEKIKQHFGDGGQLAVQLKYVAEDRPLGTAGALGLVSDAKEPLLVINGDIFTRIDFRALVSFHRKQNADLTVCVRQFEIELPYGLIESENGIVKSLREKPKIEFRVNAGIYLLEPTVLRFIPGGNKYDMTDLIDRLLEEGRIVASFPVVEYWLDIGQHDDFQKAQQDVKSMPWAA